MMKNYLSKILTVLFFVLASAIVFADESQQVQKQATEDIANRFQNYLRNISTLTTSFQQNIHDDSGKLLQSSSGVMYLKRPKLFRFETKSPVKQLIVADGTKLWIYDPDLEQVAVKSLREAIVNTPALLLTGDLSSFQRDYNIQYFKEMDKEVFLLSPTRERTFKSIKFVFENEQLKQMIMLDQLDQKTQIDFLNLILNKPISDKLFHFVPPKGVDIIRS